jgi:hypothetical protein
MRAKINYHSGLLAALKYNYKKVEKGEAIHFDQSVDIFDKDLSITYPIMDQKQNGNQITEKVIHMSLNFQPGTPIDLELFKKIQDEYIKAMGWGEYTYKSFLHTDKLHPHIHIVAIRDKNAHYELKESKKVIDALVKKYDLIKDYSIDLEKEVQKVSVANQVKETLQKVQKAKNIYTISQVENLFNSISPTFKMYVDPEKKTIAFVHDYNTSFLDASNIGEKENSLLYDLYKIVRDKNEAEFSEKQNKNSLKNLNKLDISKEIISELNSLQYKNTEINKLAFLNVFEHNFKEFKPTLLDNNEIVFINKNNNTYFSLNETVNSSRLFFKATYSDWEKKIEKNIIKTKEHETNFKENKTRLNTLIGEIIYNKEVIGGDLEKLKSVGAREGIHFLFTGNKSQQTGNKQITGWSIYDEKSGLICKMSDINRIYSWSSYISYVSRQNVDLKNQGTESEMIVKKSRKGATKKGLVKKMPSKFFSPFKEHNNIPIGSLIRSNIIKTKGDSGSEGSKNRKTTANSESNSVSNIKKEIKNNIKR